MIYDYGFNKTLYRNTTLLSSDNDSGSSTIIYNPTSGSTPSESIGSGSSMNQIVLSGFIRGGQTDYNAGTGFWLGNDNGTYKFSIGNSGGYGMTWDGSMFTVSGTITATAGDIGGWDIVAGYLYSLATGTPTSSPTDGLVMASGNSAIIVYEDGAKRAVMGYLSSGVYGFRGYATNGSTIIFEMSDTRQIIGGWTFTNASLSATGISLDAANKRITVGASNEIIIDGTNKRISIGTSAELLLDGLNKKIVSSNYVSGVMGAGFYLDSNLLEVGNIACRGIIRTAVFQKDIVSAMGGNFLVLDADVLDVAMTSEDNSTLTIEGNTDFAVGDILRIKNGTDDEWFEVTNIGSAPTYTVTRDKAGSYSANNNPAWTIGSTVTNYKQSGDGGVYMTASETNAPYLSVFDHAGSPWDTINTRLRLGNLNGYLGYSTDLYGIAIGETNKYLKYDPTNGLRVRGIIDADAGLFSGITFKSNSQSSIGGDIVISNADALFLDMTGDDDSTLTITGNATFAVNDILHIKADLGAGTVEEWLAVTDISSAPTYTVTRDLAGDYSANANPVWTNGVSVVRKGNGTVQVVTNESFSDDFNRSNRELNGDNSWVCNGGNSKYAIVSNEAKHISNDTYWCYQNLGVQSFPISGSFTTKEALYKAGYRYHFDASIYIGANTDKTNGISINMNRTSEIYSNSSVAVKDGSTTVATKSTTFQYTTEVLVEYEILADGSGSVTLTEGASTDTLSWSARTWTNGGNDYFGFETGAESVDIYGCIIDNITYNYCYLDGVDSGSGGWLQLTGSDTNAPYYSVYQRNTGLYSDYQEVARFGNLNGMLDYVTNKYGVVIGDEEGYLKYDTTNGFQMVESSMVAGIAITAGQALCVYTDGKAYSTDGLVLTMTSPFIGFAMEDTAKDGIVPVLTFGSKKDLSSLTIASNYYLNNATHTIDQSYEVANGGIEIGIGVEGWTTFTTSAGITHLSAVAIKAQRGVNPSSITIKVKTTGGTLLGTTSCDVPSTSATWIIAYFPFPVPLSGSTQYNLTHQASRTQVILTWNNPTSAKNYRTYYSTNRGIIGTSAGTVSKKVGLALSATQLLILNT